MIVKSRHRIKRWIPAYGATLTDVIINSPVYIIFGLLFLTGTAIKFGFGDGEIQTIPIPEVPILGYLFLYLALSIYLPPAIKWHIDRGLKVLKRKVVNIFKARMTDEVKYGK